MCSIIVDRRGRSCPRGKINYERRMLSEGLAEMTPVIDWHSPNEIVILSSENGSAENPPNPNTFAGKCAVLNKKSSRVRLHRKRIAPEAPNVRIMKGFRQPPNGQKIPKILVGSDFVAKSSPETVTSAAAAAVDAAANVSVASTNSAASRNDGVPAAAATTTTTTTSGAAASGAVLPELPAKIDFFFNMIRKDKSLLVQVSDLVKDPDNKPFSSNEDLERRLRLLQVVPYIASALQNSLSEAQLKGHIKTWISREGSSPYANIPQEFFHCLPLAWRNHILASRQMHQHVAQSVPNQQMYFQQQQQYTNMHQHQGYYQQAPSQQQFHHQQYQQQYQQPQRQQWQPGQQYIQQQPSNQQPQG